MNQTELMREALQKVAELRGNVYESESKSEMQALIDAFMACEQALAAEPAPNIEVCDSAQTDKPAPLVRLTEEEVATIVRDAAKGSALNRDGGTSQRIANAIMDKMIAKNGGKV